MSYKLCMRESKNFLAETVEYGKIMEYLRLNFLAESLAGVEYSLIFFWLIARI